MKNITLFKYREGEVPPDKRISIVPLRPGDLDWEKEPVYREGYFCFLLLEEGEAEISINDFKSYVKAPCLVCGIPGDLWKWKNAKNPAGHFLCFEASFLVACLNGNFTLEPIPFINSETRNPFIPLSQPRFNQLKNIINEMEMCLGETPVYYDLLRVETWQFIFLAEKEFILNGNAGRRQEVKNHLMEFINLVNKNYYERHDTKFYAEKMNITTNYLNKICNNLIGLSAYEYIQNRIISEAKVLLRLTNITVNEVAYRLGFENPNYFIRLFKKVEKITPGEYQKKGTL